MIATALQLITFARSLSAKTWLVAFALAAILAAGVRLVSYGEHREAMRVATVARADTIRADVAVLRVAQAEENTALANLNAARPAMVAAGVARSLVVLSEAKDLHLTPADSLPAAIITLINADDAKITSDSIYIAAVESLKASIGPLETAHATLDTTLIHPLDVPSEPASSLSGWRYAITGILAVGARVCYNLVLHKALLP